MRYSAELKFLFKFESFAFPFKLMVETDDGVVFQRNDQIERSYLTIIQTSARYYLVTFIGHSFYTRKNYSLRYGSSSIKDIILWIRENLNRGGRS